MVIDAIVDVLCNCEWVLVVPSNHTNGLDSEICTSKSSGVDQDVVEEEQSENTEQESNTNCETPEATLTLHFIKEGAVDEES